MSALILILAISLLVNGILIYIMVKRKIDPSLKTKHVKAYEEHINDEVTNDGTMPSGTSSDPKYWTKAK